MALLSRQDRRRITVLVGDTLSPEPDEVLEAIVASGAKDLGVDSITVSLVLSETAWFRADVGLPPELSSMHCIHAGATPAQYVVRDEAPFEISDLANVPDAPQELLERWGYRGYAGAPLRVSGIVVGSLDMYTRAARSWQRDELHHLRELAGRASTRLSKLALRAMPHTRLIGQALVPAFAELRNALMPLYGRLSTSEVRQLPSPTALAARAAIEGLDRELRRVSETIAAIESLLGSRHSSVLVRDVVHDADTLSRHRTMLVGGVHWNVDAREAHLDVSGMTSTAVLAAGLAGVAQRMQSAKGIAADVRRVGSCVEFALSGALAGDAAEDCAASVGDLATDAMIDVRASEGAIVIAMSAA